MPAQMSLVCIEFCRHREAFGEPQGIQRSDVFGVYRILQEGNEGGVWTFEEAHCGNPNPA